MPNITMPSIGGLPNMATLGQPVPTHADHRRPSYSHTSAPPTPQSANGAINLRPQMVQTGKEAAIRRLQKAKLLQEEADAWNFVMADNKRFIDDAKQVRSALSTALEDVRRLGEQITAIEQRDADLKNDLDGRIATLEHQNNAAETSVAFLRAQVTVLETEKAGLQQEKASKQSERERAMAEQAAKLDKVTEEKTKAEDDLRAQRNLRLELEEKRDDLQEEIRQLTDASDECNQSLEHATRQIEGLNADVEAKQREIDRLESRETDLIKHRAEVEDENIRVNDALDKLRPARQQLTEDVETLKLDLEASRQAEKDIETSLDDTKDQLQKARKEIKTLTTDLNASRQEVDDLQALKTAADSRLEAKATLVENQKKNLESANEKLRRMSSDLNKMSRRQGTSAQKLREKDEVLEEERAKLRELEQRAAQDRDVKNAIVVKLDQRIAQQNTTIDTLEAANEKLESSYGQVEASCKLLAADNKELQAALEAMREEQERVNREAYDLLVSRSAKKSPSAASEEKAAGDEPGKTQQDAPKPSPVPEDKTDKEATEDETSKNVAAGHITPPPDHVVAVQSAPPKDGRTPHDHEKTRSLSTPTKSTSNGAPQSPAPQIKIPLPARPPSVAKSPVMPSPLMRVYSRCWAEQDANKAGNGKRRREEEHTADPRLAKRIPTGPSGGRGRVERRDGAEGVYGRR